MANSIEGGQEVSGKSLQLFSLEAEDESLRKVRGGVRELMISAQRRRTNEVAPLHSSSLQHRQTINKCLASHYFISQPGGALQQRLSGVFVHDKPAHLRWDGPDGRRGLRRWRPAAERTRRVRRGDLCVFVEEKRHLTPLSQAQRRDLFPTNTEKQAPARFQHLSPSGSFCLKHTLLLTRLKIALSPPLLPQLCFCV